MAGLGLRYCPQHPSEPLILVSKARGAYWRCEHADGCCHTENAVKFGARRSLLSFNKTGDKTGRQIRPGKSH